MSGIYTEESSGASVQVTEAGSDGGLIVPDYVQDNIKPTGQGPASVNLAAGEGLDKQWPPWNASGWGEAKSCVVLSVAFFCNFLAWHSAQVHRYHSAYTFNNLY
jgi:hypothetical protein